MTRRPVLSPLDVNRVTVRSATLIDRNAVRSLLSEADLPLDGLDDAYETAFVAEADTRIVGAIALEPHGDTALLRSAVVHPDWRGRGIGSDLTNRLIDEARARGVRTIFLLTLDAERFFGRHGFGTISRSAVPEAVLDSPEFRYACPSTATVMRRSLS